MVSSRHSPKVCRPAAFVVSLAVPILRHSERNVFPFRNAVCCPPSPPYHEDKFRTVLSASSQNFNRRQVLAAILIPLALIPAGSSRAAGESESADSDKAVRDFREVTGLQDLAFEYTNQQKFAQAEVLWTKLIAKNDTNAAAFSNRGNCRTSQGKFSQAVDDFDRAIVLASEEPDPHLGRGVALEGLGRYREAIKSYEMANKLSQSKYGGEDAVAINNIGNAYGAVGEWETAYSFFKKASDMDSRFVFALANEALAQYQLGQDELALKTMRFLTRKYPGFGDMHAALAMASWERGMSGDAETEWYKAVQSDARYRDVQWVKDIRRWPPRLVQTLEKFVVVSPVSKSSKKKS